jgi:hypothetical protein
MADEAGVDGDDDAMAAVFTRIFHARAWGGDVPSGPGSSLARTQILRPRLEALFRDLSIASLVDAPCGDGTWIFEITKALARYDGFDVVPELIEGNRRKSLPSTHHFHCADITCAHLPRADAILCRDGLVHLPNDLVMTTIANFKRSRSRYLIATTFPGWPANVDIELGDWRPLDLQAPPFDFPAPLAVVFERAPDPDDIYHRKALGVWSLERLGKEHER